MPMDYVLVTIEVPDDVPVRRCAARTAPAESQVPKAPVYFVPSVIVPQESNAVLFPHAPGFRARVVSVEPFSFDARLLK